MSLVKGCAVSAISYAGGLLLRVRCSGIRDLGVRAIPAKIDHASCFMAFEKHLTSKKGLGAFCPTLVTSALLITLPKFTAIYSSAGGLERSRLLDFT